MEIRYINKSLAVYSKVLQRIRRGRKRGRSNKKEKEEKEGEQLQQNQQQLRSKRMAKKKDMKLGIPRMLSLNAISFQVIIRSLEYINYETVRDLFAI